MPLLHGDPLRTYVGPVGEPPQPMLYDWDINNDENETLPIRLIDFTGGTLHLPDYTVDSVLISPLNSEIYVNGTPG